MSVKPNSDWKRCSNERELDNEGNQGAINEAESYKARLSSTLALCAAMVLTLCPATADAQDQPRRAPTYAERQDKINAWTVGLAAGLIEGAPLRLATETSRVVDDGENLHVLPIVTRGPTENLNSLLYLRGVDLAIINSELVG